MTLKFLGYTVAVLIVIMVAMAVLCSIYVYLEGGYPLNQPLTRTITVDQLVPGKALERNPGFIDDKGDGYIIIFGIGDVQAGRTYKVYYFCGRDDGLRKVIRADLILPQQPAPIETPDVFKCRTVNGACQ